MKGWKTGGLGSLPIWIVLLAGCQEDLPTSGDPSLIPVTAHTIEVRLPFEAFARDVRILGGYGSPWELNSGQVARDFGDELTARTLIRLAPYPTVATVRDPSGTNRPDSVLTFLDGELLVVVDTLSVRGDDLVIQAEAMQQDWDFRTATWEHARDGLSGRDAWEEPGAGPVRLVGTGRPDPEAPDTIRIPVDSATVAEWGDLDNPTRGVRISAATPETRAGVRAARLRITTLPSINPDTLIHVDVQPQNITFIYSGLDEPDGGSLRVGGVPAWRTVFRVEMPATIPGTPELCQIVSCPVALTPDRLIYAALVLTTQPSGAAFEPRDTLPLDVRPVLAPELLPRSPLGLSMEPAGRSLAPGLFQPGGERTVEIPLTPFLQDIVRGERLSGEAAPTTLALLSAFEPVSMDFFTFAGGGRPGSPVLRLLITETDGVNVR